MSVAIELRNVTKSFKNKKILNEFNLVINKGEMVALVGPSGCGKSTLLNIIGALEFDYEGSVYIENKKISKNLLQTMSIRKHSLSYLFQNFALLENETVGKNLKIVSRDSVDIKFALSQVGLEGYWKEKIYTLSGGEQQRVAMARLLLKKSNIILADEPTGSLDKQNAQKIFDILLELKKKGKTIVVVTHDLTFLSYFDKVININEQVEFLR
ncbi:ATP-binding cassette domain-containing protein [Streptococcus henryi]|jgi:putative ABC transport system ATP-binding protein|uniref:ATP-binding cassette domain-containing protein n=1 Tax=Streptococcus henryi TaxID=439219 RepID=UPI000367FC6A|nr:ATP-binding cassette domain-containing protein [Streptococcus henryi]